MKKFLIIIYLLFLSCDSSELFGVHELDDTTLDYYDYIARGWQAIFNEDYPLAFSDFNQATLLDSIDHKNSAYVGLGWTSTFSANSYFNSSECIESADIECADVINNLRLNAKDYFDLATISCLDTLATTLENWDNTQGGCNQEGYIYSDVELAEVEYEADNIDNDGIYLNTFEEFYEDLEIGKIYLDLLEFDMAPFDLSNEQDSLNLIGIINNLEQFLNNNQFYHIASNKPQYFYVFDFDFHHIAKLISQLLLRIGDNCKAEYYLIEYNVCSDIYSEDITPCYDYDTDQCNCNDIDEQLIFECIQANFE